MNNEKWCEKDSSVKIKKKKIKEYIKIHKNKKI